MAISAIIIMAYASVMAAAHQRKYQRSSMAKAYERIIMAKASGAAAMAAA